jgi:23S rRNA (adenine2503-C2)-methyltransferase
LTPSLSTIAPEGKDRFFEQMLKIKNRRYKNGHFQLQFTIHTTDIKKRDKLIPARKWGFKKISEYGEKFFGVGDKKIALNFALIKDYSIEPAVIRKHFDPEKFLIKITPLNPTEKTVNNKLHSDIDPLEKAPAQSLVHGFQSLGFDVIVSIGQLEENQIGSNCGQFLTGVRESVNCF